MYIYLYKNLYNSVRHVISAGTTELLYAVSQNVLKTASDLGCAISAHFSLQGKLLLISRK